MTKVTVGVMVALIVAATGCSAKGASPSSRASDAVNATSSILIVPRASVGRVEAGMTSAQVVAELGEPDSRQGKILNYLRSGFSVAPNRDGVVAVVQCGDPSTIDSPLVRAFDGRTAEGIGMRSTQDELFKAYGKPDETELSEPGHYRLTYSGPGLMFILQDQKVHHITVNLRRPK